MCRGTSRGMPHLFRLTVSSLMTVTDSLATRAADIQRRMAEACARAGRSSSSVALLPVSKTFSVDDIREAMALGMHRFGENTLQEIRDKAQVLTDETVPWVVIGHTQTNKARDVAKYAHELQSLDRLSLAEALHRKLDAAGRTLDVLVQIKTSSEPSKHGLAPDDLEDFLRTITRDYPTLRVRGLMTLATHSGDAAAVRACFQLLRDCRDRARAADIGGLTLERLSMGMSDDFEMAIEEGSTEVRIGTALFGKRDYGQQA